MKPRTKYLIIFIVLGLFCFAAQVKQVHAAISAPTQLDSVNHSGAAATWVTASSTFPAGSMGIMLIGLNEAGETGIAANVTVADNAGNIWTVVAPETVISSAGANSAIAYHYFSTTTTARVTASFNSMLQQFGYLGYITGVTATPFDASGGVALGTNQATESTITTNSLAENSEIVFVVGETNASSSYVTWPGSYSSINYSTVGISTPTPTGVVAGMAGFEYAIVPNGYGLPFGSGSISWTGATRSAASIATFEGTSQPPITRLHYAANSFASATTTPLIVNVSSTSAGDLLVAQIYNNGSTNGITTVQSSDGSSFTLATSTKATNVGYVSIYYLADAPSGITSVTANHSNLDLYMNVAEYSGVSQTNPLDVKNSYFSGTATSTTYTAGGITTTQGDDLLVGNMFYGALTNTSTLPWAPITSNFAAHGDRYSVFDIQNAGNAGNYDLSGIFATPATWGADIVAFKAASVGAATTTYTQAGYQWYANQNSSTPGPVLAAQNTSTTLTATGEAFRLRMLLAVDAHGSAIGVDSFVLQFANKGTGTSCSTTQFAYANITTSTVIAYNTNSSVANGSAMTATSTDPTDAGRTVVEQTYQSGGVWGVTSTISAGQDGNWDFSLIDNGSPASTDYCFQAVYASSTPLYAYSIYPEIKTYTNPNPTVSIPIFNGGGAGITLTPNTTTTITVVASTTDPGGAGNISYATGTIYRTSLGPNCVANNLDCYQIPSSSCVFSGSTSTVTCTTGLWYFAQSTGNPSSSFPSDSWMGAITVKDGGGYATTATSTNTANVNVLTAINVTTSSINYGTLIPNTNTGSTNQTVTVQNVGNSSTTLQLSGTAFLNGGNTIATSSQHYATSTFTFGGSEPQLSDTLTTVSGFILAGPTSTSSVQGNIYWGDAVPSGMPKGTYVATTTFSAAFSH